MNTIICILILLQLFTVHHIGGTEVVDLSINEGVILNAQKLSRQEKVLKYINI